MTFYDDIKAQYFPELSDKDYSILMNDIENEVFRQNPDLIQPCVFDREGVKVLEVMQNTAIEAYIKNKYGTKH